MDALSEETIHEVSLDKQRSSKAISDTRKKLLKGPNIVLTK